jgi:hypothetical protein
MGTAGDGASPSPPQELAPGKIARLQLKMGRGAKKRLKEKMENARKHLLNTAALA